MSSNLFLLGAYNSYMREMFDLIRIENVVKSGKMNRRVLLEKRKFIKVFRELLKRRAFSSPYSKLVSHVLRAISNDTNREI